MSQQSQQRGPGPTVGPATARAPDGGPGTPPRVPQIGDFLPDFQLVNQRAAVTSLVNKLRGKPVLVIFYPDGDTPACQQQLRAFAEAHEALAALAEIFVVSAEPPERNAQRARNSALPFTYLLSDAAGQAARAYGVTHNLGVPLDFTGHGAFTTFLADPNRRILRIDRDVTDPDHAAVVLAALEAVPRPEGELISRPAPVLYVPRVFDRETCQRLIRTYHEAGNIPSGVQRDKADGSGAEKIDPNFKLRRDHTVKDRELNAELRDLIGRRVVPEIAKAFFYRVTNYEVFKIVCYDAETGGYFRTHRDNTTVSSAHRRFAMTINLNTGDYQGGALNFPEYGPDLYSPGVGDAVVFSCSVLHEARPVTAGQRYALLAFFYGADAEALLKARPPNRR